jgi:putative membrane protein
MKLSHGRYVAILAVAFGLWWTALALRPVERGTWALENALAVGGVALLFALRRKLPFSKVSYTLIFVFLCLHEVGAHYTYSKVPYEEWLRSLGVSSLEELLGWTRNHFDRLVHFSYGLLLAYPVREIFLRVVNVRGFWGYFLPLDLTMSTSMIFELLEWAVVAVFGGGVGQTYLGTQGDEWDAQKDMTAAFTGAVLMTGVAAVLPSELFLEAHSGCTDTAPARK